MKLTIIGASGHGRVAADIAELNGYDEIVFLDDDCTRLSCGKWSVIGGSEKAKDADGDLFVAIGNSAVRKRMMEQYADKRIVSLIHPKATLARDVIIGVGTIVMAGAVINPATRIGRGVIINTNSTVDHDCAIGDYVHVAIGANIAGTVCIGAETWIGAGATIINNLTVCANCIIGAGGVAINDIKNSGTYVGVPARMLAEANQ